MMDNEMMEARIRRLAEHTAPDQLSGILEACEARKGNVITMNEINNNNKKKKKKNRFVPIAVAAALVLVCLGGYLGYSYGSAAADPGVTGNIVEPSAVPSAAPSDAVVDSIITLDVNPSLNIIVDAADKVIEVQPLNDDARTVIGDMDFAGSDLDVTVNALIGSMLMNGYLDDIRNSILVSVANGDTAKAESLQQQVSDMINSAVGEGGFEASVLTQTVTYTSETASLAQQYGISEGKAELILKVVAADPTLTVESLAPLSVNDISLIASSRGLSDSSVSQTGTASSKAYISVDDAKSAAYAHAGVSASDVTFVKTDFDSEHGVMVYEVEFYAGSVEYEYDINAQTGEVVKYSRESKTAVIPSTSTTTSGSYIGEAAAKTAALSHAGVSESDVCWLQADFDRDDGVYVYELEFSANGLKYDYNVNALTGEIVKFEQEQTGNLAGNGNGSSGTNAGTGVNAGTGTNAGTGSQSGNGYGSSGTVSTSDFIGEAAAKSAALSNAGVSESEVTRIKCELDRDHGSYKYEIEFSVGRMEYDYEVDAYTGAILKAEHDYDD